MKLNGFTLIELLVVVAIIGILAAVGVVAYNGYTNSAKVAVSKSNHSTAVKKLNLLIQECDISPNGKVKLMLKRYDKTEYEKGCWYDVNTYLFFRTYFTNDLNYLIENGYYNSVIRGISIPFTLISNIFFQFTGDISTSLRITGSLFTFILILYFMLRQSLIIENKKTYFIYFLFLISTTGGSFYGTNDSIFFTLFKYFFLAIIVKQKNPWYKINYY